MVMNEVLKKLEQLARICMEDKIEIMHYHHKGNGHIQHTQMGKMNIRFDGESGPTEFLISEFIGPYWIIENTSERFESKKEDLIRKISEKQLRLQELYKYNADPVDYRESDRDGEINKFRELQEKFRIHNLYHITHVNNLNSILENGIFSLNKIQRTKIDFTSIASERVQQRRKRRSLHDYVPLFFTAKTPMLSEIKFRQDGCYENVVFLILNTDVMLYESMRIADGNAASSSTDFYRDIYGLEFLPWEVIGRKGATRYWVNDEEKRKRSAEVLTLYTINKKYIVKVCVQNKTVFDSIKGMVSTKGISMFVDPNLYF